MAYISGTMGAK